MRRVRTPTVLQMETVECGAASIGMVLGYFGRFESLDTLRVACGVSRDGSKAANIIHVAKQYGCDAKGYRKSAEDALKGPFPTILFWNFNHFLVLEGASKSHAYLNDPAVGRRAVPLAEFETSFSGVSILIEPGPDFKTGGRPASPIVQLLRQAMEYRTQLVFVLLIGVLIAIPGFTIPNITGLFVDDVLLQRQKNWLAPLAVALIVAILAQASLSWLKNAVSLRVETHMAASRSAAFLWHVLRLPSSFFALRYLGDITNRVTSVQTVAQLIATRIGTAAINLFTASVLFGLMLLLDPVLATIAIAGALINVVVLGLLRRVRFETSLRLSVEEGKLFAASAIGLKTIESLKASGREDDFFSKWSGYHARAIGTEQVLSRLDQLSALVPSLIVTSTMAIALWIGGARVMDATLTLGGFIAFQALFSALVAPVQQMVDTAGKTQQVAAQLIRLDDVLKHPLDWRHASKTEAAVAQTKVVRLELDDLTFGYSPQAGALVEGFNLDIRKGGWVALVGGSGSGKTTIGKLASGLYTPWSGRILIDGRDITSIGRQDLGRLVGSVDQEIVLFEGSLKENLTLWDSDVPQEDLVAAARDAQIFDVIASKAGNFDARVEENGRNFSGGERQRIEIARALVRSPALLVLDEATSALDPDTEFKIMAALRKRGMSCLIVAHRLSTIRDCDEIIVLERGRVVERGTHDQLLAMNGSYSRLIKEGQG